jgi:Amt family ammonium transporter
VVRVQSRLYHSGQQRHCHDLCQYESGCRCRGGLITAPCATVTPFSAIIIGAIAGVLVVLSVLFFDKIKVDDPVGAISVHGVCGAWGTLAAGIFNIGGTSAKIIGVQLLGIGSCFVWAFGAGLIMFKLIDATIGLRVTPEEETEGLDYGEHAASAYPDFQVASPMWGAADVKGSTRPDEARVGEPVRPASQPAV